MIGVLDSLEIELEDNRSYLFKDLEGKNKCIFLLGDVFGFAEHQRKATDGLGFKLELTRNTDEAVLDKTAGLVMLEKNLIVYTGTFLKIHLPFNKKVYWPNRFQVRHPWSYDFLSDLFKWKQWIIRIYGISN